MLLRVSRKQTTYLIGLETETVQMLLQGFIKPHDSSWGLVSTIQPLIRFPRLWWRWGCWSSCWTASDCLGGDERIIPKPLQEMDPCFVRGKLKLAPPDRRLSKWTPAILYFGFRVTPLALDGVPTHRPVSERTINRRGDMSMRVGLA